MNWESLLQNYPLSNSENVFRKTNTSYPLLRIFACTSSIYFEEKFLLTRIKSYFSVSRRLFNLYDNELPIFLLPRMMPLKQNTSNTSFTLPKIFHIPLTKKITPL